MSNLIPPDNPTPDQPIQPIETDGDDFGSSAAVNSTESNYSQSPSKSNNAQGFVETSQQAFLDVLRVFKSVWDEPTTGLPNAIITLGDSRIFHAGIVLCILFVLSVWIAVLRTIESLTPLFSLGSLFGTSYSTNLSFSEHLRIILAAIIPVLGMIGVLWSICKIFKGSGNYQQFTFVAGFCFAPLTFFLLMLWLLGSNAAELMALISVFCWTTFVLFLNTALIEVLGLSSRNALLLVPIVLVADFFITRVGVDILY